MDAFMCCCAPCKPRYRRLVDAIYPSSLTEGLINSNMQKLTFYAISRPEKLDRIGEYIVSRLSRDLYHQRYNQVKISVEAMDQLLQSCHDLSSLNKFIEHFLKMLQKLLETNHFEMEKLAIDSFVNFANIEENTPAYHREYDFFISKFASMCHANSSDTSKDARYAGLRGLREELRERKSKRFSVVDQPYAMDGIAENPKALADQFIRELMAKAPFGLISVLDPVLKHCDLHSKWEPPPVFAVHTFRAIMYSVKDPSFVIQALITHLENMSSSDASVRIGIATVLSSIVSIAGTSIGPSLIDYMVIRDLGSILYLGIFNSLLKHLRQSVEFQQTENCPSVDQEKIYQESLINAMGDYAYALPDYQKVEIMLFISANIPNLGKESQALKASDTFLQHVLVKTLLKVATKYRTGFMSTIFGNNFPNTLLQLALATDPIVRLDTQCIFHTLLDRHDNLAMLRHLPFVNDVSDLRLTFEKCSRSDEMIMRNYAPHLLNALHKCVWMIPEDESQEEHMDAILCTMTLLCIEVGFDEMLIQLFRLSFALQAMALESSFGFSGVKRIAIHNLVAKYLNFSSQLMAIPSLCQHVQQIVKQRSLRAHPSLNLLSDVQTDKGQTKAPLAFDDDEEQAALCLEEDATILFDIDDVSEMLKASGKDVKNLALPFVSKGATLASSLLGNMISSRDWPFRDDKIINIDGTDTSGIDDNTISIDISIDWSPSESVQTSRKNTLFSTREKSDMPPTNVNELRKKINTSFDPSEEERKEQKRTQRIVDKFRTQDFNKLVEEMHQEREEIDLSRTVKRLLQRNDDANRMKRQLRNEFAGAEAKQLTGSQSADPHSTMGYRNAFTGNQDPNQKKQDISDEKNLVVSFIQFLRQRISREQCTTDQIEGIEVAIQCLETAFDITDSSYLFQPSKPLLDIFVAAEGLPAGVDDFPKPTAEEIKKANNLKEEGNALMKASQFEDAVLKAAAYCRLEQYDLAIQDCRAALALDPKYSKAYGRMGLALSCQNRYEQAVEAYKQALELDPEQESYRNNLKIAEDKLKELEESFRQGQGTGLFGSQMPDMTALLNNPAMMNMARQLMSDPNIQNMMSQMMTGILGSGTNAGVSNLIEAGQQLAQQMQSANPDLVEQLRQQFQGQGGPSNENDRNGPHENGGTQPPQ
uniref:SGTA homodimerisation domain-containing protein n=1 Tax=Setaria digitata TaxID=48799 RepID=A0A915PVY7_9BILA